MYKVIDHIHHVSFSSRSVMIFQGDKFEVLCLLITFVAGFFSKATAFLFEVYFKNINGPILGIAHLDLFAFLTKTS